MELAGLGLTLERHARHALVRSASGPALVALERIVAATLESPGVGRLADRVLDDAVTERLVARVIDGALVDEVVARLERSEELWALVERIARSPAVTDAISSQGMGFADQVSGVVRDRSTTADARVEGIARRLLRREPRARPEG